jgi:ankyrin repeat protein
MALVINPVAQGLNASIVVQPAPGSASASQKAAQAVSRTLGKMTAAFHQACDQGRLKDAVILIPLLPQEELELLDKDGMNALHHAVESGSPSVVRALLKRASDSRALALMATEQGTTPLMLATLLGSKESDPKKKREFFQIIRLLLKREGIETASDARTKGCTQIDTRDSAGQTPLIVAASYKDWEFVKFFLAYGADINAQDKMGYTALLHAAYYNVEAACDLLMEKGASVKVKNANDDTPVSCAVKNGNHALLKKFLAKGGSPSDGICEQKGQPSFPPLLYAARSKDLKSVELLLAARADVNQAHTHAGKIYTPFSAASFAVHNQQMIDFLVKKGAKPEILPDPAGLTVCRYPKYEKYLKSDEDQIALSARRLSLTCAVNDLGVKDQYEGGFASIFYQDFADFLKTNKFPIDIPKTEIILAFEAASRGEVDLDRLQRGGLVVMEMSSNDHAMSIVCFGGYMVRINRANGTGHPTADVCRIDPRLFDKKMLEEIQQIKAQSYEKVANFIYEELPKKLSPKKDGNVCIDEYCLHLSRYLSSTTQTSGNCPYASVSGAFQVCVGLLDSVGKHRKLETEDAYATKVATKDMLMKLQLKNLENYLLHFPGENVTYDKYLVGQSWKKIQRRLKHHPVDMKKYPEVRRRLVEPELNKPLYKKAFSLVGRIARGVLTRIIESNG